MFSFIVLLFAILNCVLCADCPGNALAITEGDFLICTCTTVATASGNVWGVSPFTHDSVICRASVYMYFMAVGGSGDVQIKRIAGESSYDTGTRNGIATNAFGVYGGSIIFVCPSSLQVTVTNGERYHCYCTTTQTSTLNTIWGDSPFTYDSNICNAAVFMQILSSGGEGAVELHRTPGESSYAGGVRNGITANSYGVFSGSYVFTCLDILSSVGEAQRYYCFCTTTQTTEVANVWGISPFTSDSKLCRAAVYMGFMAVGGSGFVEAKRTAGEASYGAEVRNGITTNSFGAYGGSVVFYCPVSLSLVTLSEGDRFHCICSTTATSSTDTVYGSHPFTIHSDLCRSAVFMNLVNAGSEAEIEVVRGPTLSGYKAGVNEGVSTTVYGGGNVSYTFVGHLYCEMASFPTDEHCSGHGDCVGIDVCQCEADYFGGLCNITICEGVMSNETQTVCSGHGECIGPNNCSCDGGYYDDICNRTSCFGVDDEDYANVCSGRGNCTFFDDCECEPGSEYFGPNCNITMCYEVMSNGTEVCGGHGKCSSRDNCSCDAFYGGEDCCCRTHFQFISGTFDAQPYPQEEYSCDQPTTIPPPRSKGMAFAFRNFDTFVFGGQGRDGQDRNDVWRVRLDGSWCFVGGNWTSNSSDNIVHQLGEYHPHNQISSRSSFGGFATITTFIVFGGSMIYRNETEPYALRRRETNEVWEFCVIGKSTSRQWRKLVEHQEEPDEHSQPTKRKGHCSAKMSQQETFFFGGQVTLEGTVITMKNDLWVYQYEMNTFTKIANGSLVSNSSMDQNYNFESLVTLEYSSSHVPYPRSMHTCWTDSDRKNVFVFGGLLLDLTTSNDVWIYNSTKLQWAYVMGNNWNFSNSISSYYDYDTNNLPSVRAGAIYFTGQYDFRLESGQEQFFFGGRGHGDGGTVWSDFWGFSNGLMQFRFVNGTSPLKYKKNRNFYDIGSRSHGLGVMTRGRRILVFGGRGVVDVV